MKYFDAFFGAIAIAGTFLVVAPSIADADVWTYFKNKSLEAGVTEHAYTVPTTGLDVRVFEFTPKSNPNMICVMAFGQTNAVGLQCFEKNNEK
jgi:hypothetical protein